MAKLDFIRGVVVGYTPFLLIACISSASMALPCGPKQYFSINTQTCMNCSICEESSIVMRPCNYNMDTVCGTISDFFESLQTHNPHRHNHKHNNHHRHKISKSTTVPTSTANNNQDIVWLYGDEVGKLNSSSGVLRENSTSAAETVLKPDSAESISAMEVLATSEAPFSSAETLIWDWQEIAFAAAVFACMLFFLVMALYSLHQARQWRRLKENFEADVEELSARLSLMAASTPTSEKDFLDGTSLGGIGNISPDGNYLNNRCVYLEQLLSVRKDVDVGKIAAGNVYIEENGKT